MLFNSYIFVLFLGVVLSLYNTLPKRWLKYLLVVSSYFFYGWWDWRFLSLIIASTLIDFTVAKGIESAQSQKEKNALLWISIGANLGMLGFFKYFNFFVESFTPLLDAIGFKADFLTIHIVLPVGISFYTFQTLSYTIDVWRGSLKAEKNLVVFAAFVSFFPQLVAGPIERASNLLPQMREKTRVCKADLNQALWLITWGYFLKVFLADNLASLVDDVYSAETYSGINALFATYAFAFQIFGDFAGYSYIAIGVALLFGIKLNENFRFPYLVTNPSAFWQNWHISLSSWLRDYLYIPLGGNRGSTLFTYRNLILTMALGGLWHGAAWTFVAWGFYQGIVLVIFRIFGNPKKAPSSGIIWIGQIILMFHITCVGWMLFRAPTLNVFGDLFLALSTNFWDVNEQTAYIIPHFLFYATVPAAIIGLQFQRNDPHRNPLSGEFKSASIYAVIAFLLIWGGNWGTESFIYFQF